MGTDFKMGWAAVVSRVVNTYPVRLAFLGSLVLSLIAIAGVVTVARDAAFYLTIAQRIAEQGPAAAVAFDWPWFAFLLAGTHLVLHLPLEWCAYLWCTLFLAGTCALMVDCVRQRTPQAATWACLVVLAMPAVNAYRNDILREFGFWFFCTLTLWLALRWQSRGGWLRAAFIHLAIVGAALFRLEALLLLPALGLWQLPNLFARGRRQQFLQFVLLPVVGAALVMVVLSVRGDLSFQRIDHFLAMVNPQRVLASFQLLSKQFAGTLINDYSKDQAGQIILFGMLATVLISFIKLLGPFSLAFLHRCGWSSLRTYWEQFRPFAWAALLYIAVLMLFFIRQQFMISRYVSFLDLLLVPLVAVALSVFASRFPRLGKALIAIGVLVMLSNVISTGARKTQYLEAARWVQANIDPQAAVLYEDGRVSYYAGRGYVSVFRAREREMTPERAGAYSYFVIDARSDEPWLQEWLARNNKRVLAEFANRKKATVLIIGD